MTSAGLLALAVGHSLKARLDEANPVRDPAIDKGFGYLAKTIGKAPSPRPNRQKKRPPRGVRFIGAEAHGDLYYLWSLERVAMIYDLTTILGKDWYAWAAHEIVDVQHDDGSWPDSYSSGGPPLVDSCFALLVLKRVNVAIDLTKTVKQVINVKELEGPSPLEP